MQLVINTYGAYIHRSNSCFEIKVDKEKKKISPKKVDSILILTGASLSSDAIKLALENNIEIQFLDKYGDSFGKIWHSNLGSTTTIRRKQLNLMENEAGLNLIKEIMLKKVDNSISHLEDIIDRSKSEYKELSKIISTIKKERGKLKEVTGYIREKRSRIMGLEGNIGKSYFKALNIILPKRYKFQGRSSRPAKDEFNCLLNYGYGILYSRVEMACILAGLDPYIGILHTDNYNKTSFVFDVIEPYRHFVDRNVIKLLRGKKVKKSSFGKVHGGLTLNKKGKEVLISKLNKYLDEPIEYDGRRIKRKNVIQYDMHKIANQLIEIT